MEGVNLEKVRYNSRCYLRDMVLHFAFGKAADDQELSFELWSNLTDEQKSNRDEARKIWIGALVDSFCSDFSEEDNARIGFKYADDAMKLTLEAEEKILEFVKKCIVETHQQIRDLFNKPTRSDLN